MAARSFGSVDVRRRGAAQNARRGRQAAPGAVWRRTELGTNHIACFGVWRRGTRRQAARADRSGTTRWHMPHRAGAADVSPQLDREIANQD
ncbi:MAG: hypothetical protein WDN08_10235 [Rhizomicrobium sp.]